MSYSRLSNVILATASVLTLVACSSGESRPADVGTAAAPPAVVAPIDTAVANALAAPATPMPANATDTEKRLAQLELDVAGIKSQMVLVRPILEKMPALQDKLGELVSELQRIDARVASAQMHAENMTPPAVAAAPTPVSAMEAPFKTTPKMAPIVEPANKPAAKAVIEPVSKPTAKAAPVKAVPAKMEAMKEAPKAEETMVIAPSQAALSPAATPALVATPTQTTASVATTTGAADLQHIRVGDDAEKTRVVLDLNRKVSYTYDLDNVEKILILDIDAPTSSAVQSASFANSPLVSSYAVEAVAGGKSRIVMQLRAPVKIANTSVLPPNGDKGDRIVVDLVAS